MRSYFWIAIGAGLGGAFRFWCGELAATLLGNDLPWGTMFVNVAGSLIIGFFATLTASEGRFPVSLIGRQFVMVGFCGGYTTFSSFSLQTMDFMQRGRWAYAGANILSIALSIFAVWAGHIWAMTLNPPPTIEMDKRDASGAAAPWPSQPPKDEARQ